MHKLYYGDNLVWLSDRSVFPDGCVDLIYLDPPFNSNATYSQLFKTADGKHADSQIEAFEDTWVWGLSAEAAYKRVIEGDNTDVSLLLSALRGFLHDNAMMAYLAMMAARLVELHRVLKPTGSLYLHCDPTASHYLKLLLDAVFGPEQFLNHIIWKRTFAHGSAKRFGPIHDDVLFYSKNGNNRWQDLKIGHDDSYVSKHFRNFDQARAEPFQAISLTGAGKRKGESGLPWRGVDPTSVGRHWAVPRTILAKEGIESGGTIDSLDALDRAGRVFWPDKAGGTPRLKWFVSDLDGARLGDVWTDVPPISANAKERLGYPTQKPLALLERIIAASSNPGDVVLDPFCGCGTAVHAAEKLGRRWIGIDITHLAISLVEKRLRDAFPGVEFQTEGRPKSLADAEELARRDKHEFQKWVVTWIGARPWRGGRKGADGGIDGLLFFSGFDAKTQKATHEKAIVSVKGGQTRGVGFVADLVETIGREQAALGVLIMAAIPTREMEKRAAAAGFFDTGLHGQHIPRIQILTLAELWQGKRPQVPNISPAMFKAAKAEAAGQPTLEL